MNWNYREDDDTMLEAGEDFAEDMESCEFELVGVEVPSEGEAE
ncbi:MAG: SiaC family regulatory phosphoprotein [Pseudomonadota bacterium]|nr:SiaC family regulatory phosphoprotein [Pseudomonadota bacterium]